jgi:uncharacterized protein YqeY
MLVDDIKAQMTRALREKDEVARNVLGVALGEIQTAEARANRALRDDEAFAILRKLVKSNEETLSLSGGADAAPASPTDDRLTALRREIEVLSRLLPAALSVEAIEQALAPIGDALRAAKSEGQAMGLAMKHLKTAGAAAEAASVQRAVSQLRARPQ